MAGGPCSRGGLPKTIWPLQCPRRGRRPLRKERRSRRLNSQLLNQTLQGKIKKGTQRVSHLNPDPFKHFIGPKNWGEAIIDGELVTCLLDNGAQLNFMTPAYAEKRNFDVYLLERLAQEIGRPSTSHTRHRWDFSQTHWFRYGERTGSLC